jgi:predicted ATP-dependent endonuclease of OLD family
VTCCNKIAEVPTLKLIFKNFRGIREGSIDLKNLNILIGGNNSGKTTVLEGLFLIPNPFDTCLMVLRKEL